MNTTATRMNTQSAKSRICAIAALLLFYAFVSWNSAMLWEDSAKDQHSRMYGEEEGGASCAMHINWSTVGKEGK